MIRSSIKFSSVAFFFLYRDLLDSARPTSFYARLRRCGSAKSDSGLVYRTRSLFCFHGDVSVRPLIHVQLFRGYPLCQYFIPSNHLEFMSSFRFQRIHSKCFFCMSSWSINVLESNNCVSNMNLYFPLQTQHVRREMST